MKPQPQIMKKFMDEKKNLYSTLKTTVALGKKVDLIGIEKKRKLFINMLTLILDLLRQTMKILLRIVY